MRPFSRTLNQQHFFQSWLDATKPPAAVALDGLGIQSAPSEMETFCHVPAQVSAALRPEGGSPKQTGRQDGHSFVHPNGNNSDDTQSRKVVDDVPCGSPGDRRPTLPAPEVSSIQTAEHPEPPSEAQGSPSAESADGKSASDWVVPATEIVHADVLDVKKGNSETEPVTLRIGGAGRRDMASSPKKSGIFSAIASVGLGKAKTHPISTGKEEDTLLVDKLEAELKEIEAFAKQFAKDAVEWARLTTRSISALRTWLVFLWKSISDTESESEAFEAFSDLVEKGSYLYALTWKPFSTTDSSRESLIC